MEASRRHSGSDRDSGRPDTGDAQYAGLQGRRPRFRVHPIPVDRTVKGQSLEVTRLSTRGFRRTGRQGYIGGLP